MLPSLREDRDEAKSLHAALGGVHTLGHEVDWEGLFEGVGSQRADLPTYAFQRQRYWLNARSASGDARGLGLSATDHPLLGAATAWLVVLCALRLGHILNQCLFMLCHTFCTV